MNPHQAPPNEGDNLADKIIIAICAVFMTILLYFLVNSFLTPIIIK